MALPETVANVEQGIREVAAFLAFMNGEPVQPTDEKHEQHEQVPLGEGQTPCSGPVSVVAQSTCPSPAPMNNNPGGTCSKDGVMSDNLSNNKIPGEGTYLNVVVHDAQVFVSQCGGCGQPLSDQSGGDDFGEEPAALFGLCTRCAPV